MYCQNCGIKLEENARFCQNCGRRIEDEEYRERERRKVFQLGLGVVRNIQRKEKISLRIWIGVICFQILVGFFYHIIWLIALWNVIACYTNYKYIKQIERNPVGIYFRYQESLVDLIIVLLFNISMGAVVGIIAFIYDLLVRNYVLKNKDLLLHIQAVYLRNRQIQPNGNSVENKKNLLRIRREKQRFLINWDIRCEIVGGGIYNIKDDADIIINIPEKTYEIIFSCKRRKTCININTAVNDFLYLRFNRMTGKIEVEIMK